MATLPLPLAPTRTATVDPTADDHGNHTGALPRPLPLGALIAHMLATCRRMAAGGRLDEADCQFMAALLARARLRLDRTADSGALQSACAAVTATYLWFWRAVRALERAAPAVAGLLTTLPTPRSALRAADALSGAGAGERSQEEEEGEVSGVAMARHAIARLAGACRERGLLPASPYWSAHDTRPYRLVLYPQDRRGRAAVLLRGERVVMGVAFGGAGAGSARIKFTRPRLLPAGVGNARPYDTAAWFAIMVDRMVATAGARPTASHRRPRPPVTDMEVSCAGAFDVPRGVSAALLAGDRPDTTLTIACFDDVCIAAWLRGRPRVSSAPPAFNSAFGADRADNVYASDDEDDDDGSCKGTAMAIDSDA
ncbi:hypothetical protein [Pandoravirus japonicus]|uniref:DUF5848 domain-containing protein n=1 Tax=Pandoravirus japonicus TaxID=2823154 RepID=A0A811BPT3_9VIRU|nr:hypothetical protein [Pandoravirus japonicus]